MVDLTVDRLAQIDLQQLRSDAYRRALIRAAPRRGSIRLARLLRAMADRFERKPMEVAGPWSEDYRTPGWGRNATTMATTHRSDRAP